MFKIKPWYWGAFIFAGGIVFGGWYRRNLAPNPNVWPTDAQP